MFHYFIEIPGSMFHVNLMKGIALVPKCVE